MTDLWYLHLFALLVAAGCALSLSRRDASHRPLAALLAYNAVSDVVRAALALWLFAPERARLEALGGAVRGPFTGWTRVAWHLGEQGLHVGWSVALAWCGVMVFRGQKRETPPLDPFGERGRCWGGGLLEEDTGRLTTASGAVKVLSAWAAIVATLAGLYPDLSGIPGARWNLATVYAWITFGGMLAVIGAAGQRWAATLPRLCMLVLAAAEAGALVSETLTPFRSWVPAQAVYLAAFALLAVLLGRRVWKS